MIERLAVVFVLLIATLFYLPVKVDGRTCTGQQFVSYETKPFMLVWWSYLSALMEEEIMVSHLTWPHMPNVWASVVVACHLSIRCVGYPVPPYISVHVTMNSVFHIRSSPHNVLGDFP